MTQEIAPRTPEQANIDKQELISSLQFDGDEIDKLNQLLDADALVDVEDILTTQLSDLVQQGTSPLVYTVHGVSTDKDAEIAAAIEEIRPGYTVKDLVRELWWLHNCQAELNAEQQDPYGVGIPPLSVQVGAKDTDGDGFTDEEEVNGVTARGALIPGADPLRKDVYIQVNWMTPRKELPGYGDTVEEDGQFKATGLSKTRVGYSFAPKREDLEVLIKTYAALKSDDFTAASGSEGITVHIDAGKDPGLSDKEMEGPWQATTDDFGEQTAGGETVPYRPFVRDVFIEQDQEVKHVGEVDRFYDSISPSRAGAFYLMVFADQIDKDKLTSGTSSSETPFASAIAAGLYDGELLQRTMLHEFGHNLGLGHNGARSMVLPGSTVRQSRPSTQMKYVDLNQNTITKALPDIPYNPEYQSLMSYCYQLAFRCTNLAYSPYNEPSLALSDVMFFDPSRSETAWDYSANNFIDPEHPEWSYVSDSDNLNLMASGSQSGSDGDTVYLVDGVLTTELPPYEPEEDPNPLPPELIDFPGDFWADRVTDVLDASAGAQSFIITVENYGKNDFVFDISVILGRGKPGERTVKLSVPTGPRETVEVAVPILPEDMVREKLIDGQRLPYRITDGHHKFDSSIRVSNLPLPTVTATATATTTSVATETTTVEPSPVSETVTLTATTTTSPEPTEPFESTKDPTQIAGGSTTGESTDTTAGDITGIVVGVVGLMAALAVAVGSFLDNLGIVVPKITDFL
ncbi:MAG: hypothetical protein SPI77_03915 [Corynebacterium sp.]|nr:hypothetical protein [Corynebacterium sp.]